MADYSELALEPYPVSAADVDTRARFITRTYGHLAGAVAAFTALEVFFFKTGAAETIAQTMLRLP